VVGTLSEVSATPFGVLVKVTPTAAITSNDVAIRNIFVLDIELPRIWVLTGVISSLSDPSWISSSFRISLLLLSRSFVFFMAFDAHNVSTNGRGQTVDALGGRKKSECVYS
jgi:hypothetical protein